MTDKKNDKTILGRFALKGPSGLVGLIIVALIAFSLGALFFGGEESSPVGDQTVEKSAKPEVWTCSMHPQIKLPKPGKCPICFMDLILLDTGPDDDLGPRQLRLSEAAKQLARIETSPVVRALAEAEVRMVGKVAYDETRLSYITAWVPGRLDRLFADFTGIKVAKGDHMVEMYSPELVATQEELLQASAAVQSLSQSSSSILRSTATATLEASREKLRLFGLDKTQIDAIESSRTVSEHLTINAPVGGVVIHKNAQEGMYVKTGTRIYTIADLSQLWVVFEAYESDLVWLRYGQQIAFNSPSFPGETFEALISFIDPVVNPKTRTVQIRAIVSNDDFKLKPDMFIRGTVKSRVDASGKVVDEYLAGKWISPMHPEVIKDGPGQCDVCGMDLVTVESLGYAGKVLAEKDRPLLVPITAPMITGKRAIVYVELENDEGPLFEGRVVELGPRAGDFYVVKSGLAEGERVVTNGAFKIDSELQIQAKPSMMSPDGGVAPPAHQHGGDNQNQVAHEMPSTADGESPETIAALTPLYDAYFAVQMALASDDHNATKSAAADLIKRTTEIDMGMFSRSGHMRWMELSKQISTQATLVNKSDDIEAARLAFYDLSKAAIDLQETFGHGDSRDYYLTFCPMAMNNTGAYWLQTVDTVYNSFYGASMLRCGEIKKPLAAEPTGDDN